MSEPIRHLVDEMNRRVKRASRSKLKETSEPAHASYFAF